MRIKGIQSEINWIVEHNNLSYVRIMYITGNEKSITWKRNFDQEMVLEKFIVDNKELEEIFLATIRETKIDETLSIIEKEVK